MCGGASCAFQCVLCVSSANRPSALTTLICPLNKQQTALLRVNSLPRSTSDHPPSSQETGSRPPRLDSRYLGFLAFIVPLYVILWILSVVHIIDPIYKISTLHTFKNIVNIQFVLQPRARTRDLIENARCFQDTIVGWVVYIGIFLGISKNSSYFQSAWLPAVWLIPVISSKRQRPSTASLASYRMQKQTSRHSIHHYPTSIPSAGNTRTIWRARRESGRTAGTVAQNIRRCPD